MRRSDERPLWLAAISSLLALVAPACLAPAQGRSDGGGEDAEPSCLIAQVGAVGVTVRDAQTLRGFIAPPPTLGQAARLAVEATVLAVATDERGAASSGIVKRLKARNGLLAQGRESLIEAASDPSPSVRPGPCGRLLGLDEDPKTPALAAPAPSPTQRNDP